jgi:signal transduction histidine kinase/ligand-binding sensor domain-containing protein/DNA-binding response OmpR family regulator
MITLSAHSADFKALGGLFDNKTLIGQFEPGRSRQVLQDSQGFIWVATDANGLLRYDGTQAEKIDFQASFADLTSELRIESIVEDNEKYIWVRTLSQGIYRYDQKKQWIERFPFPLSDATNNQVLSLTKDSFGELWMATRTHIAKFNQSEHRWQLVTEINHQELPKDIALKKLFIDAQQTFWIVSEKQGIFQFSIDAPPRHFFYSKEQNSGLGSNGIMSFLQDKQGDVFFGTTAGLALYNAKKHEFITFPLSEQPVQAYDHLVTSIAQRDVDHLWLGTFKSGVMVFDKQTQRISPFSDDSENSINDQEVNDVFVDDNQTLWVATEAGVSTSTMANRAVSQWHRQGIKTCQPNGFINIQKVVYFICSSTLYQWEQASLEPKSIATFSTPLLSIEKGKQDQIWLGSLFGGLIRYDLEKGKRTHYPVNIDSAGASEAVGHLLVDKQGVLWGATVDFQAGPRRSIIRYDLLNDKVISYPSEINTTVITELDGKRLLLSGFLEQQGPFIFNKENGEFTNQNKVTGNIYSALNDGKSIWLGTSDMGVIKYHPQIDGTVRIETIDNSFTAPMSIISDAQNGVYFHDNDKVYHWTESAKKSQCISCDRAFPKLTSLYRGTINLIDNQLLIGSQGLAINLDLQELAEQIKPPNVYLSSLDLFNRAVRTSQFDAESPLAIPIGQLSEFTLDHNQQMFTLHFGALALLQPQHLQFYFQMGELNDDWLALRRNVYNATFTTLPMGEYLFRVKAVDRNTGLSGETKIKVIIKPAPWLSIYAQIAYILLLLLTIFSVIRWRTRTLKINADRLQQGIHQRTQELSEKNTLLAEKNSTIEALLSQKQRMFANMSHEFRTPLTLILSPLERLFNSSTNTGNQKFLSIIDRNARILLRLVEQMLKLAQLETTNRIQYKQYQVNTCLKYVIASFEGILLDKQLSVSTQLEGNFSASLIDGSLETIVANLLSNAIKYTPEQGAISITVKKQAQQLLLIISDTGLGIAEKDQQKVLEPFYRDDADSKHNIKGSGIGLALVKELVDVNNGRLILESTLGKGSCFTIYLPCKPQSDKVTFVQDDHYSGESFIASNIETLTQDKKILKHQQSVDIALGTHLDSKPSLVIIEDNQDMRDFLFDILNDDYQCIPACNGKDGIKLVTEQIPDIVICDLMMPSIDGLQVCNTLKNDERTSHIPLMLLTAKSDTETRISGWRENIDDFVSKPFNETELKERLINMLTIRSILKKRFSQQMLLATKVLQTPNYLNEKDQSFLTHFIKVVNDHLADETFNRAKASSLLAVSERQLQRKLSALTDHSFTEYVRFTRLEQAKSLLGSGLQVSEVVERVGFSSLSYFGACFKAEFGQTPKQFQLDCHAKT